MRTNLLLRLQFMLINTYVDLCNWIHVINYTKFEHLTPKCPVYGEKSSFMGIKAEFFNRIRLYMRTFFHLRLQFMLFSTYMDSFNKIYVIISPNLNIWGQNVQFVVKSPVLWIKKSITFNRIIFLHAYISSSSFAIHAYWHIY
jgi:hypothetical protein